MFTAQGKPEDVPIHNVYYNDILRHRVKSIRNIICVLAFRAVEQSNDEIGERRRYFTIYIYIYNLYR